MAYKDPGSITGWKYKEDKTQVSTYSAQIQCQRGEGINLTQFPQFTNKKTRPEKARGLPKVTKHEAGRGS